MLYGGLYDPNMPPSQRLGLGVYVRYVPGEGGELLHLLTFLAEYADARNLTNDDDTPAIFAAGSVASLKQTLPEFEAAIDAGDDILVNFDIFFYDRHQPIFKAYLEALANEKQATLEHVEKIYRKAERDFFPTPSQAN